MRLRSILVMFAVLCISYSTLTVMVTTLRPILSHVENYSRESSASLRLSKPREKSFYKHHADEMQQIVADSSILEWVHVRDDFDLHQLTNLNSQDTHYVETHNLCGLAQAFQRWRESVLFNATPHVLWWRNPTDGDDPIMDWIEQGCTVEDLVEYLDHEDTLAVMVTRNTTGVRLLEATSPKLFPITTGMWQDKTGSQRAELWEEITETLPVVQKHNRTLPLMIVGDRAETTRTMAVRDRLVRRFGSIKAVYHPKTEDHTLLYENFLKSQFVLGVMSGDHDWVVEALALGAIPILEEDNSHNIKAKNGYHRMLLSDLPVVWIDDYDNLTPELLEMEYAAVLHDVNSFKYAKLTQMYWVDQALDQLEHTEEQKKHDAAELARLVAKREERKKKKIFHLGKE